MGTKHRLTAVTVSKLRQPGNYPDGGGLFLQVQTGKDGAPRKSWLVRYTAPNGKRREMGLGSVDYFSLAEARRKSEEARRLAAHGQDPIDVRDEKKRDQAAKVARTLTFEQCAEAYVAAHRAGWKSEKHAAQWSSTLKTYAFPVFGDVPVGSVDVSMVMRVLDPIWQTKTETAARLRGRIESVLDWAAVRGHRSADNPARWRGHLEKALPARARTQKVKHFSALPINEAPAFVQEVLGVDSMGAKAFAFCILTATRTSETLKATWAEVDLDAAAWTIPGDRMKAGRPHRVPLSDQALKILSNVKPFRGRGDWLFPGRSKGLPLSNMAFLMILRRMGRSDLTGHGFRSTFRDWAAEFTATPREVVEAALAHTVQDKVEAAYLRSDLFEKRRRLMHTWAEFCFSLPRVEGQQ